MALSTNELEKRLLALQKRVEQLEKQVQSTPAKRTAKKGV